MSSDSIELNGLEAAFSQLTLLRDREGSNAWTEWYQKAGLTPLERADTLIVPDPNVRVQAVADGQGVALNDELVEREMSDGKLFRQPGQEFFSRMYPQHSLQFIPQGAISDVGIVLDSFIIVLYPQNYSHHYSSKSSC